MNKLAKCVLLASIKSANSKQQSVSMILITFQVKSFLQKKSFLLPSEACASKELMIYSKRMSLQPKSFSASKYSKCFIIAMPMTTLRSFLLLKYERFHIDLRQLTFVEA